MITLILLSGYSIGTTIFAVLLFMKVGQLQGRLEAREINCQLRERDATDSMYKFIERILDSWRKPQGLTKNGRRHLRKELTKAVDMHYANIQ